MIKNPRSPISFLLAGLMVMAAPVGAANSLSVNGAAALSGDYGLEISLDGATPQHVFVEDDSPNNEPVYRAEFAINTNDYTGAVTDKHALLKLRDLDGPINNHLTIGIRQDASGLIAYVKIVDADHPLGIFRASNTQAFETQLPQGTTVQLGIEFQQGPSNNGIVRLYKNGVLKREHTGLNNSDSDVDRVQWGSIGIRPSSTPSGSYYLDDFQSFRSLSQ